jgi:hypothetical protein
VSAPHDPSGGDGPRRRTRADVAAELADVERYLLDVPPHQGGGRDVLERRRAALQRELASLRAAGSPEAP